MPRKHIFRAGPELVVPVALICALLTPPAFAQAQAQADPSPPIAAPPIAAPPIAAPPPADASQPPAAVPATPPETPSAAEVATLRAELDELKKGLQEVKEQQGAAEVAASQDEDSATGGEPLKIYGFMDMGAQHVWGNPASPITHAYQLNSTSFMVGNINLYFDAQPIKYFRGLLELRFTNAPLGDITNYGGIAGTFQRKNTFSYDPGGSAINAPMWGGTVILERAWIEWNQHQALKVRVGNFFTPFGIWNQDHGTPTLISLALPQFIVQRWMPIRQTGVMLYGNTFAGDWELGYAGTLSNGRQEISTYNFDNNFGLGARAYARRDTGQVNTTFGLSYFTGKTEENEVNLVASPTGINGLAFVETTKVAYNEHVVGADVSIDLDATRIRAEAVVRRQIFVPGKRKPNDALYAPGSFMPDQWQESAYLLVANQLPWYGIEPYLEGEVQVAPRIIGDVILIGSVGVNIHFNSAIQWKNQVMRAWFKDWLHTSPYDVSLSNLTSAYSRLVMAF